MGGQPGAVIPPCQPIRHGRPYGGVLDTRRTWPHSVLPQADAGRAPMSKAPVSGGLGCGVPARERHERFDRHGLHRHEEDLKQLRPTLDIESPISARHGPHASARRLVALVRGCAGTDEEIRWDTQALSQLRNLRQ